MLVHWPSGLEQRVRNVRADRELVLEEPVHCMEGRPGRGPRGCSGVRFDPPDLAPVEVRVPRWARPLLPEEGPICQAFVDSLSVERSVCHRLAIECRRRAARLPGSIRENLECALPDVSTFGCGASPFAELLDVCDCFDFPE
jgi:hypothetical protein